MPKILPSTKHFQLAQQMRKQIRSMQPGDPMPTVAELRKDFGVSQATVDRAFDRLRQEGLIVRPAGQLRLVVAEACDPATHRVALIRPDYPSPTFEELARVIVDAGKTLDWAFELVYYRKLSSFDLKREIGDNDAGILLPNSEPFTPSLLAALRRPRCPMVIIQDPPAGLKLGSVRIDDEQIGRLAVEHLASLGHRRILLVLSEPHVTSGDQRADGWRKQMEAMGETNLDELVVDCQTKPFDNSMLTSYDYFNKWLAGPRPHFTAIFCACFTGASPVLRALREHKIAVPGDVSVIAHGGEGYMAPFVYPPLTAVETDLPSYGRAVVEMLQKQLDNPDAPTEAISIPSTLVVRETTGPLTR